MIGIAALALFPRRGLLGGSSCTALPRNLQHEISVYLAATVPSYIPHGLHGEGSVWSIVVAALPLASITRHGSVKYQGVHRRTPAGGFVQPARCRLSVGMHTNATEVVAKAWFHESPRLRIDGLTRRAKDLMNDWWNFGGFEIESRSRVGCPLQVFLAAGWTLTGWARCSAAGALSLQHRAERVAGRHRSPGHTRLRRLATRLACSCVPHIG